MNELMNDASNVLRNGVIIRDKKIMTENSYIREKIINYLNDLYYIKMINGKVINCNKLDRVKESQLNFNKKIAYNYLFTNCYINGLAIEKILKYIDSDFTNKDKYVKQLKRKKGSIKLIKKYVVENYKYYKNNHFIAFDYLEINTKII